jgi:hypothetical protein
LVHKTQDEDKQNTTQLLTLHYVVKRIATCKKIPIEIEIEISLLTKSGPQYRITIMIDTQQQYINQNNIFSINYCEVISG